ncbi:hypothetical protein B1A99_00595 [Cohnella sp. CIP 111063]|uniref:hypothetical protein n=1 Tax=unclassified Cohnella TaxID=2636738 RepID=UPI000B8C51B5|nr:MULTISPECIES: hypothetical protein [unclassified Cohnella]OXS62402.1 hypothetical protein B1A99_00595 [Cohnella sp. CIP 111063]PRX74634.1 hypothetical protein B0G52_101119 [Cohnella sp. SGD-V74]
MNLNPDNPLIAKIEKHIDQAIKRYKKNFKSFATKEEHGSGVVADWFGLFNDLYLLGPVEDGETRIDFEFNHRLLSPRTEESTIGADLIVSLKMDLPEIRVEKGILIQHKLDSTITTKNKMDVRVDTALLKKQVSDMLSFSPSSYVMVSSIHGFDVIPAIEVSGAEKIKTNILASYSNMTFGHFISRVFVPCFTGDSKITGAVADANNLSELLISIGARKSTQDGNNNNLPTKPKSSRTPRKRKQ